MLTSTPLARTVAEAHAYMDMRPCECQSTNFERINTLITMGEVFGSLYEVKCANCGTQRKFVFSLTEYALAIDSPYEMFSGHFDISQAPDRIDLADRNPYAGPGASRSALLDPVEWFAYAGMRAEQFGRISPRDDRPNAQKTRIHLMSKALAAIVESTAFLEPDTDQIDPSSCTNDWTRERLAALPGRYSRERLNIYRDTYAEQLDQLGAEPWPRYRRPSGQR